MWRASLVLAVLAWGVGAAAQPPPPNPADQILAVMQASEDAWNAGDIPGFMDSYWRSDELRFASGGTVTHGWTATRDRYLARYTDRSLMGTLVFSDLTVEMLGPDSALLFGKWELRRAADRPHGLTSLVFRRLPEGWRIVHDHTSSAD